MAAVGLVFGAAGPASAVEAGAGAGTGWEYIDPGPYPAGFGQCGLPTAGFAYQYDYFELDHESTYDALPAAGAVPIASYVGPTQMQITTDAVIQAPQGAAPGPCGNPLLMVGPAPVPITEVYITGSSAAFDVSGTGNTGEVECWGGAGANNTYTRIQSAVVFTFEVTCAITGNVIPGFVTGQAMVHVVEGTQTPCQIPIVEPIVTGTNTYVDNPECVALGGGEGGRASSHLVTTFEAAGP